MERTTFNGAWSGADKAIAIASALEAALLTLSFGTAERVPGPGIRRSMVRAILSEGASSGYRVENLATAAVRAAQVASAGAARSVAVEGGTARAL